MITEEALHRMEEAFNKPGTDSDRLNRAVAELRKAVTPDNQVAHRLTEGEMILIARLIQVRVERAALKKKERTEWQETMNKVISRETYEKMIAQMQHTHNVPANRKWAQRKVDELLEIQGEEVEPEPVLPGISDSLSPEWTMGECRIMADGVAIAGIWSNDLTDAQRDAYAQLWCAAPKVVKLAVAVVKAGHEGKSMPIPELVDALKEAGAKI